jgi:hypothetical protein
MKKLKLPGSRRDTATAAVAPKPSKPTKAPKSRPKRIKLNYPKIPSSWRIFLDVLKDYRAHWKPYIKILAVVAIPAGVLSVISLGPAEATIQNYVSFASIAMNIAFLWAASQTIKKGVVPKVRSAYYDGSTAIVRFLLISMAIVFMLIPAALGAAFNLLIAQYSDYFGVPLAERIILGSLAAVLALPSLFLMVRFGLSLFVAVHESLAPIASFRRARLVTLGRFWTVAVRMISLLLVMLVTGLPAAAILVGLSMLGQVAIGAALFQIVATLTVLPIANLYMLKLYLILEDSFSVAAVEQLEGITDLEKQGAQPRPEPRPVPKTNVLDLKFYETMPQQPRRRL